MVVKLTVALPRESVLEVELMALRADKTRTQILREAIALKHFITRELAPPRTRLLVADRCCVREVEFVTA
jgi:predicted transcriptional regulator